MIKYDHNHYQALNLLGAVKIKQHQYDEAINLCHRAISLDKDYFYTYATLGVAYYKLGDIPNAMANLNKALSAEPNYQPALETRDEILSTYSWPNPPINS